MELHFQIATKYKVWSSSTVDSADTDDVAALANADSFASDQIGVFDIDKPFPFEMYGMCFRDVLRCPSRARSTKLKGASTSTDASHEFQKHQRPYIEINRDYLIGLFLFSEELGMMPPIGMMQDAYIQG